MGDDLDLGPLSPEPQLLDRRGPVGIGGGEQGVMRFVAEHLDDADADRVDRNIRSVRLRYADYDWALNRR